MKKYPGVDGESFIIQLDNYVRPFKNGEVISQGKAEYVITKVYRRTWWRRLLFFFGFKTKWFDCIKVKPIKL